MHGSGLRLMELLRLRVNDVDQDRRQLKVSERAMRPCGCMLNGRSTCGGKSMEMPNKIEDKDE